MANIIPTPTYLLDASAKPVRKELEERKGKRIHDNTVVDFSAYVRTNRGKLADFVDNFNDRIAVGDLFTNRVESKTAFAEMFGARRGDVRKAVDRLSECSIRILGRPSLYNGEIRARGRVRDIKRLVPNLDLFGVEIDGATYRYRHGAHEIAARPGTFVSLNGLDNTPIARPHFRRLELVGGKLQSSAVAGLAGPLAGDARPFSALDLMPFYNVPDVTGKGEHICIIALGGGWNNKVAQAIVDKIFKLTGKKVKVNLVTIDGARNRPDPQGADIETNLDVAGALGAYDAEITIILAPNSDTGFAHAIGKSIDIGATVITISWGSAEVNWTDQAIDAMHTEFQRAQLKGITVYAAAGDDLAPDRVDDGKVHADYPSSDTCVISAIGTWLSFNGKTVRAWNNATSGTGGGVTGIERFAKARWETLSVANLNDNGIRHIVGGLAFPGDPSTGLLTTDDDGNVIGVGGTSAGGPVGAGHTARANQALGRTLGFFLPFVAANRSALCRLVTDGNNSTPTVPGYNIADICYGMLDNSALISMLKKAS